MSIVERAIKRLQKSRPEGPPKQSTAVRPARSVPREPLLQLPESPKAREPKESIETPYELLRSGGMMSAPEHEHALADQFRRVKWPVLESAIGKGPSGKPANVVMVSSSVSGEGKTFCSFNLALSIARERDVSVLLVDADVAKRHATRVFRTEERTGLTEVLAGVVTDPEDVVVRTSIPGLTFKPAGRRTDAVPELFASQRMSEVVQALGSADRGRIVLFDSSPLLATNESQVLCRVVDQVVFIVRAEVTTQPMVIEAISLLDKSKEIRCLLNQARSSDLTEYYYGYGSYYPNEPQK